MDKDKRNDLADGCWRGTVTGKEIVEEPSRQAEVLHNIYDSQCSELSRKTKIRIHKTITRPVLLYGGENWILSKNAEKIINENKFIRAI